MVGHRTRVRLIGDILSGTRDGASVSRLTKQSSASHYRVVSMVQTLVNRGLVEPVDDQGGRMYRISARGRDFLQEYNIFRSSSEKFGIPI